MQLQLSSAHVGQLPPYRTIPSLFFGGVRTHSAVEDARSYFRSTLHHRSTHGNWRRPPPLTAQRSLSHTAGCIETDTRGVTGLFKFPDEAVPTSSGYLPVSDSSSSRLFYVFYEATNTTTGLPDTPLLLWLNGGPGCSSLIGCFYELGPWRISEDGKLQPNQAAWNRRCGVLFVDNPVGTGFSVAVCNEDVPKDQHTVAAHLYHALQFFLAQNPSFKLRPLFLAGESYAGKYIPALAYYILKQVSCSGEHPLISQLAGIAVGNGFTDPRIQVQAHAEVSYSLGLLDKQQSACVQDMARVVVDLIDKEEWLKAHEIRTKLCGWIEETSGVATLLDIRRSAKYHHREDGTEYLAPFLNSASVKATLKVDEAADDWVSCRPSIRSLLAQDTMKSSKWMVEAVLKGGYPVLLYQGIYDAKDGVAGSENWMRTLEWDNAASFWEAKREVWRVKGKPAGYWRRDKNLAHVVVHGAGHQVPADQPVISQTMIETWIEEQLKGGNHCNNDL